METGAGVWLSFEAFGLVWSPMDDLFGFLTLYNPSSRSFFFLTRTRELLARRSFHLLEERREKNTVARITLHCLLHK